MAEACRIIINHTLNPMSLFQNPSSPVKLPPFSHSVTRRNTVRCSVSTRSRSSDTPIRVPATTQEIPWGCEGDSLKNASALQRWLSDSGISLQRMAIQKVDVGERGLVALKNIRKREKLLFVPPPLVITAESEWSCLEAGEVMKRYNVPNCPLLATYLIR